MNTDFSANEARALSRFFRIYFYGDHLDDQSSVSEALGDYLNSESGDREGLGLRTGIAKLLSDTYSDADIAGLVGDEWESAGDAAVISGEGRTYKDILSQMLDVLSKRS